MVRDYGKTTKRYQYGAGGSIKPQDTLLPVPEGSREDLEAVGKEIEEQQRDTSSKNKEETKSTELYLPQMKEEQQEDI